MTIATKTIKSVCDLLSEGCHENAKSLLQSGYPSSCKKRVSRTYTAKESMAVFTRDGFLDRYTGSNLIFPGTLRLIHRLLPQEFPFNKNWKMDETHIAFWELFPTIDHVIPVARGGEDILANWVTTSQLRNSAKSNWLLEELGWTLLPEGEISQWDGLTSWFISYVTQHPEHQLDPYIKTWHKAALGQHTMLNSSGT